jgi:hypothetical protein
MVSGDGGCGPFCGKTGKFSCYDMPLSQAGWQMERSSRISIGPAIRPGRLAMGFVNGRPQVEISREPDAITPTFGIDIKSHHPIEP